MSAARSQHGFTLIETLLAVAMTAVVFGATMALVVSSLHSEQASTQRNSAQDQARVAIDLIARQLRNISSPISSPKLVERAGPYDLVFQTVGTPSGSNLGGAERVRYCVPNDSAGGTPSSEVLISQVQTWSTSSPPAIPWNSTSCPDVSPSDGSGQYRTVVPSLMNRYQQRADRPAFAYDNGTAPSDLTKITSVQMDLFLNPPPGVTAAEAELRSAVFLRNQVHAPEASFTETDMGGGSVLLNGGTSYSPDGSDLNYTWSCTTPGCPVASALAGSTSGLVVWHPGAGSYTVVLTVSDTAGLSTSVTEDVTVS
jgi:prepilin-type N-terminal cleavage/methylation domain-containing protein